MSLQEQLRQLQLVAASGKAASGAMSMQEQLRQLQAAAEAERQLQLLRRAQQAGLSLEQAWAGLGGAASLQADVQANYRQLMQLQKTAEPAKPAPAAAKPASQPAAKPAQAEDSPPVPSVQPQRAAAEGTSSRTLAEVASSGADLSVLAALSHAGLTITSVTQESPPPPAANPRPADAPRENTQNTAPVSSSSSRPKPQLSARPRFSDAFLAEGGHQSGPAPLPAMPKSLMVKEVPAAAASQSPAASAVASAAAGRAAETGKVSLSAVGAEESDAGAEAVRAVEASSAMTITPTGGPDKSASGGDGGKPVKSAGTKDSANSVVIESAVVPTKPSA